MATVHDMADWLAKCQWVRTSSTTSDGLTVTTLETVDEDRQSQGQLQVISKDGEVISAHWHNTWRFGGAKAF